MATIALPRCSETARLPLGRDRAQTARERRAGAAACKAALEAHGERFELHLYEGARHAFDNDTNAARYDRAAAELAWSRTIALLQRELGAAARPT